jgi:nitroreductase
VIFQRRAVKVFAPLEISEEIREQILDAARHAPSSLNSQPYQFYWVGTAKEKEAVAKLCLRQKPAETASALVVAVADIGSLAATSRGQLEWMRSRSELQNTQSFVQGSSLRKNRRLRYGQVLSLSGCLQELLFSEGCS